MPFTPSLAATCFLDPLPLGAAGYVDDFDALGFQIVTDLVRQRPILGLLGLEALLDQFVDGGVALTLDDDLTDGLDLLGLGFPDSDDDDGPGIFYEDDGEDEIFNEDDGPGYGDLDDGDDGYPGGGYGDMDDEDGGYGPGPYADGSVALNCGGERDVIHNVTLAADSVNDTTLRSGDTFSFNDIVGPRTSKYGYRKATNGRGVRVMGGGVAQVASALWLCVKNRGDITILEKSTYGSKYNQSYVDSSSDAIVTDYSSGRDFVFRYTGRSRLTFYTYVDDGWLYCDVLED